METRIFGIKRKMAVHSQRTSLDIGKRDNSYKKETRILTLKEIMKKEKPKLAKVAWKAKTKTVDYQAGYRAGMKAGAIKERVACMKACADVRDGGNGTPKQYEDNHADGFTDGCNECEFAIGERSNV